ncbi:Mitochondrial matrix cochaperone [Apiotrichum porosum]|uniref:GrpE protein homolog, mitochondrial n=1 Tax=Apiotrichum porosum TaxID=105984 RepID=A0A427Y688_9TREE|nr:Mitochondrial matrix cochaperone [Apiotrichum porosum]RSH86613.1 Mitochondrial matrix cochaperone [Apiotrichum porosum]
MMSRSVASLRAAVRPAVAAPMAARASPVAAARVRFYADAAEGAKAELTDDEKKIADLEAKVKELTKEMQYMRADYQTLSRRSSEEKAKASDFAIMGFARALLSTTDVLATALKHVPQPIEKGSPLATLFDGVELTQKALHKTFETHGIAPMDELLGAQFDPNLHEATFQVPSHVAPKRTDGDAPAPGEVIDVAKGGWTIKGRVLRPAQVGVVQME